ncbi:DUF6093 family protein [Streptomyces sp. NBC_01476]|uniref:DUF6093 family protein n=1 Tax=Streptomyces sp. NBC_01476 TaxID=2903881 RepID=UPI002E308734|nr:DUF6093 family protein [Streptomyces sp. NBC_01476]
MPGLDDVLAQAAGLINDLVLRDTVRIRRPSLGAPVLDPTTGQLTYPPSATVYEGPGALQADSAQSGYNGWPSAGEPFVQETKSMSRLMTPLSAPTADQDDLVDVTAVHEGGDTALIGPVWQATDPGRANTLGAVRVTPIDRKQEARRGGTA